MRHAAQRNEHKEEGEKRSELIKKKKKKTQIKQKQWLTETENQENAENAELQSITQYHEEESDYDELIQQRTAKKTERKHFRLNSRRKNVR